MIMRRRVSYFVGSPRAPSARQKARGRTVPASRDAARSSALPSCEFRRRRDATQCMKRARTEMSSSWVPGADGSIFPIQNLPYGIFSHVPSGRDPRPGVAIGDKVFDLRAAATEGLLEGVGFAAETVFGGSTFNAFMESPASQWAALRAKITSILSADGADAAPVRESAELQARCFVPRDEVAMHLPATVGDYTDFYSSREHATNVGIMFRGKDNALQPNWLHLPVGYHGRASSVVVSGTPVVRPKGQLQLDKADASKGTEHAACRLLDFELEMGFFVGGPALPLGVPLTMEQVPPPYPLSITRTPRPAHTRGHKCFRISIYERAGVGPHLRLRAVQRLVGA